MPDLISMLSGKVTPKPDEIGKVYSDGSQPTSESLLDRLATTVVKEYGERESGVGYELNPLGDVEKYNDVGLSQGVNLLKAYQNGNLEKELANAQSGISKLAHGVEQAIVSELALGIPKGISDLFDAIGQGVGISDGDYTNPVSQYLEKLQEDFKNYTPIYSDPDRNTIADGGLANAGWWAENIPSIMSSLTLLIPSAGATKGVSMLGKLSKVKRFNQKAVKFLTGSSSPATMKKAGLMFENGMTAALSRTMENYQEAQGVYADMKKTALDEFNNMNDEEYAAFVNRNSNELEDIDTNDKEVVADALAHKSATRTFLEDYANIGFDVIQLYALRNAWKGLRTARGSAKLDAANKRMIETAGMSAEEIAAYDAAHSGTKNIGGWIKNQLVGGYKTIAAEASEGVEEAVNYIAQQEGMHLGNVMLGKEQPSAFDTRFKEYISAPQLWDSAFWGVMGGVAFQGLGSTFNRIQNTIEQRGKKTNEKTKEDVEGVKKAHWWNLDELPEIKRRKTNIENQNIRLNQFLEDIHTIMGDETHPGIDIYNEKENVKFDDTEQGKLNQELTRQRRINDFVNSLVTEAANNGNMDYLKAYMSSDEVRKAMVNSGVISEAESHEFMNDINKKIDHINDMFDEEITQLNDIAGKEDLDVPVEYLQIIANNNVQHKLNVEEYDNIKQRYDDETAKIALGLKKNKKATDEQLDFYKQLVDIQVKNQELASLHAQLKQIEDDKKQSSTIAGQVAIDDIKTRISAIENQLYSDVDDISLATSLFVNDISNRAVINEGGKLAVRNDKKAIERLDNILAGNFDDFLKSIGSNKTSKDFDKDIVRQKIAQLTQDVKRITGKKSELDNLNPELKSLYAHLSAVDINRTYEQSKLTSTVDEVRHYTNYLNNTMIKARKDAIQQAFDGIVELNKKYKDISLADAINNSPNQQAFEETIQDMSDEDKNMLNDYLQILNLTNDSNKNLGLDIANAIREREIFDSLREATENEENGTVETNPGTSAVNAATVPPVVPPVSNGEGENSSISQQPLSAVQPSTTINQSNENGQTGNGQENTLNQPQNGQGNQGQNQNQSIDDITNVTISAISQPTKYISNVSSYIKNNSLDEILSSIENTKQEIENLKADNENVRAQFANQNGSEEAIRGNLAAIAVKEDNLKSLQLAAFILQNDEDTIKNTLGNINVNNKEKLNSFVNELLNIKTATNLSTGEQDASDTTPAKLSNEEVGDVLNKNTVNWFRTKIQNKEEITFDDYNAAMQDIFNDAEDESFARKEATSQFNDFVQIVASNDEVSNLVKGIIESESSLDETTPDKFTEEYDKANKNLINTFRKDLGLKKIGGKYHISIEDLLRYCNAHANSTAPGHLIYNQLVNYLKAGKLNDYVIDDIERTEHHGFLNRIDENLVDRINSRNDNQRIGVENYLDSLSEEPEVLNETLKELDTIQVGDELTYDVEDKVIKVKHNNTTIGLLGIPIMDGNSQIGQLNGWNYDISHNKGNLTSNLKSSIVDIINSDEQEAKDIIEALRDLGNYKLTEEDKKEIVDRLKDNSIWKNLKHDFSNGTESDLNLLNHFAKVFLYDRNFRSYSDKVNKENAIKTIDKWFDIIGRSFDEANYLASNPGTPIAITEASRGEQNRITSERGEAIKVARPVNENGVIADKYKGSIRIGMAPMKNTGEIIASKSDKVSSTLDAGGIPSGSTFVIIPDTNGHPTYVQAFPARIGDKYPSIEFNNIVSEIQKVIRDSITNALNKSGDRNQAVAALQPARNLLIQLLNNWKGNTPLFIGQRINYSPEENHTINIYDSGGFNPIRIGIDSHGDFYYQVGAAASPNMKRFTKGQLTAEQVTKAIMNRIKDKTVLNIAEDWVRSDNNTSNVLAGVASRTPDGKFQIKIGNNAPHVFDSFNDFIIKNNLIRVNTFVGENGDNFHRIGKRKMLGNATIRYARTERAKTLPIKNVVDSKSKSNYDDAAYLLNVDGNNLFDETSGEALATAVLKGHSSYKKLIKSLIDNNLLPEVIRFDNKLTANAKVNRTNGEVYVSKRWLDKVGLGKEGQKQAIRKLVHERLHYLIESNGETDNIRSKIREIYDAFVASNPTGLEQYINWNKDARYWDESNQTLTDEGIEEFFVESLTASDLAKYLNSVKSTEEAKASDVENESLWQKIMRVLQKLLGVNIKDNTLYAQEFMLFTEEISPNNTENIVQEDINDKNEQQEEQSEPIFDTNNKLDINTDISENYDDDYSLLDETTGSIETLAESLPLENQAKFVSLVNNGVISMICH